MAVTLRASHVVELADVRIAGGVMLAAAAARPLVGSPGLPCPLRTLTGIPCPLCGMTTSVTDTVYLHLGHALAANPVGILAVVVAIVLLVNRRVQRVALPAWVLPVGLAAMWVFELFRFRVL
ncbi:MAG TPA: DUF2752 domain-containing protein [Acidimicrobiales bacterium]|nr:DUF2752 domain-containing protein [Acidimicrobiales bacterium]